MFFQNLISLLQLLSRSWLNEAISFLYTKKTVFSKNLNLKDGSRFSGMKTFKRFVCTEASKNQVDEEKEVGGSKCDANAVIQFLRKNVSLNKT